MENQENINTQNNTPSGPSTLNQRYAAFTSKSNYLLIIILTALISAVVFGFGGYYLGKQLSVNQPQNPTSLDRSGSTPSVGSSPTSMAVSPTPSSVLVNYEHPEGLYKLRYSSVLEMKENKLGDNSNSACQTELVLADKKIGFSNTHQGNIVVDVCKVATQFFLESQFSNMNGPEATKTTLGGREAYMKTGEVDAFKLGSKFQAKRITAYKDGNAYTLDLRYDSSSPDYSKEFDQILSSFVFTN